MRTVYATITDPTEQPREGLTALSRPGDGPVRVSLPPESATAVLRQAATLG